jgi:hypothetical protein
MSPVAAQAMPAHIKVRARKGRVEGITARTLRKKLKSV